MAVALAPGCGGGRGRQAVGVTAEGLVVGGRIFPLYSGGFDYWQFEPGAWPVLIDRLSRLGLNTLTLNVPWERHETAPGKFDFGEIKPGNDLGAVLDLAAGKRLRAIVNPGPCVGAPFFGCGIPTRVLYDVRVASRSFADTAVTCHSAAGQYPLPAALSNRLYEEFGLFLDALARVIARRSAAEGGPVVALEVQSPFAFFGLSPYPYGVDYHPDALALYRRRLADRYVSIENLNRSYGTSYQDFTLVEPPRAFLAERLDNLAAYLDWTEFRQWSERFAAEKVASMLVARKISSVPVIYRLGGGDSAAVRVAEKDRAVRVQVREPVGILDTYSDIRRYCRAAAGNGRLAYSPAFGGGVPVEIPAGRVPAGEDVEFLALAAVMYGLKGWNLPLAVERDFSTASPVRRDGRIREEYYEAWSRIYRLLRESRSNEFRRVTEVVLIDNGILADLITASSQVKAASGFLFDGSMFDESVDFGFKTGPQACRNWIEQAEGIMEEVGFDWNYELSGPGVEVPTGCRVALVPSLDFYRPEDLPGLQAFLDGSGTLIFGPGAPSLDSRMRPDRGVTDFFSRAEDYESFASGDQAGAGKLIRLESPLSLGDLLKSLEVVIPFTRANPAFDLTVHRAANGRRLLFAANKTSALQRTDIFFQGQLGFRDLASGDSFTREGKFRIELDRRRIGVWEVTG